MAKTREYFPEITYMSNIWELKPSHLGLIEFLAKCNVAIVQYHLGWLYKVGIYVNQNYQKATYWHKKAIKKGITYACLSLGHMYRDGRGVEQSDAQAIYYFKLGAIKGCRSCIDYLRIYFNITI